MRGEVWTVAGAGYASKPRPAAVVQSDETDVFESTVICLFTSDTSIEGPTRVRVEPSSENGLDRSCCVMADKVMALKKSSLGRRLGHLSDVDVHRLDEALRKALSL